MRRALLPRRENAVAAPRGNRTNVPPSQPSSFPRRHGLAAAQNGGSFAVTALRQNSEKRSRNRRFQPWSCRALRRSRDDQRDTPTPKSLDVRATRAAFYTPEFLSQLTLKTFLRGRDDSSYGLQPTSHDPLVFPTRDGSSNRGWTIPAHSLSPAVAIHHEARTTCFCDHRNFVSNILRPC